MDVKTTTTTLTLGLEVLGARTRASLSRLSHNLAALWQDDRSPRSPLTPEAEVDRWQNEGGAPTC